MRMFCSRTILYRSGSALVILAAFVIVAWHAVSGQASKARGSKGPRAIGLIELLPKGKARLIPIVILVDGQYYDADAYKASPVPMALWAETEYEAFRTGVSQGVFIVSEALQNQKTNEWIGEGSWQTAEELAVKSNKKARPSIPRGLEDDSGPPVLRHSGAAKPKPPEAAPATQNTQSSTQNQPAAAAPGASGTSSTSSTSSQSQTTPGQSPTAANSKPGEASTSKPNSSTGNPEQADEQDPNRPVLKRGKSVPAPIEESIPGTPASHTTSAAPKPPSPAAAPSAGSKTTAQVIPAISDADGPEPHSYQFDIKAADETELRNKMLGLAADEVRARARQLSSELIVPAGSARAGRAAGREKPATPNFEDVQFRIFDLSSSNEPTMVLMASARMPDRATESALVDLQYFVTVVARQDINGDIHKAFSNVTDQRHLDLEPKFELVDAVDVDGDGRAELLFRKDYDEGTAYVVYRVIGDQLYPLFEGTPGE